MPPLPAPPRRLRALAVAALCLAALLPAFPAGAATPGPDHDGQDRALEQRLEQLVRAPGGPPGAIAILQSDGHTRVVRAGVADLASGRPPRPGDHMRIASTAKAFSGAVALSLVDRGVLRLDDTLRRRLPQLPAAWGAVTLRQLLNHTSGLPDYSEDPDFIAEVIADPRHHFDSRHLLDYVADQPLLFPPGSRYHYSNSDNIAVALMAEAVTGTPYERLLAELVYRPLGLRDTSLPQGYRLPRPYLHGYDVTVSPPEDVSELISASGAWASGGIVSTPADLTRFIRGYVGGALFGEAVQREQRRWIPGESQPPGPGRNSAGLALFRYETRCGTVLGHTGNTAGYTQLIAATPDGRRSLTFSVTTQINAGRPQQLTLMRAVQEDFVCALLRGRP
ncbi:MULTISPECIES: serine hydrolase domain-containing protein [Streptomyces]|uniref:Peptidase S12 n=2 Tax=Streptomyces TaxID=1883 RepID=A0A2U9PBH8_STRAS|nr:serine hydrolase domain-containing protein [Streptomyces actuosus]AWT47046.1 peptidase S12 [Streptomyces actuosus]MBM4823776.1 beta-lactamase family protein [Streptomyces actuosus]